MPRKGTPLILVLLLLITLTSALGASTYLRRWATLRLPDVNDYSKLPAHSVARSSQPSVFPDATAGDWIAPLGLTYQDHRLNSKAALGEFLSTHGSTAFIVIKDGRILDERYFNGYRRDSLFKSFSVTKSVLSAMIGIAISDGVIGSIDDPITKYLPDMKDPRFQRVTLRHLLDNTAGVHYKRGAMPWTDQPHMYYSGDVRGFVKKAKIEAEPGTRFVPEDISPILLGYVLERALQRHTPGRTLSDYLSERIWQPMGAEYDALWNVDRKDNGLEKGESGLTARAIDLARFATLYLNDGSLGTRQLVPSAWVHESTTVGAEKQPNVWNDGFHKHQWWGRKARGGYFDFYANGHFGQRLYVSPRNHLVIVRMGKANEGVDWADFLGTVADAFASQSPAADSSRAESTPMSAAGTSENGTTD